MSIGLDTSVVLRLLTGEPTTEARLARVRIEHAHAAAEPVIVMDLVLAELLRTSSPLWAGQGRSAFELPAAAAIHSLWSLWR